MDQQAKTARISIKPEKPIPEGRTDWKRVSVMTEEQVVVAALADPDALPITDEQLSRMRRGARCIEGWRGAVNALRARRPLLASPCQLAAQPFARCGVLLGGALALNVASL